MSKKIKNIIVKSLCTILLVGAVVLPFSKAVDFQSDTITVAGPKGDKVGGEIV